MDRIGVCDQQRVMVAGEVPRERNIGLEEDPGMEGADGEYDERARQRGKNSRTGPWDFASHLRMKLEVQP